MEWVETTADSIESARIKALDLLNVEAADAEIEVVEDVKKGLFGRVKTEARVRARIRPKAPAPKDDRRNRRSGGGRGRGDKNSGGRNSGGKGGGRNQGGRSGSKDGGRSGGNRDGGNRDGGNRDGGRNSGGNRDGGRNSGGNRDGGRSGGNRDGGRNSGGNRDGGNRDSGRGSGKSKAAAGATAGAAAAGAAAAHDSSDERHQNADQSNKQNSKQSSSNAGGNTQSNKQRDQGRDRNRQEPAVTEEFSVSDQQAVMNEFVSGVAAVFDQDSRVEVVDMGDDVLEAQVAGEDLGLLVGPSGATLAALEELTRTAMQRAAGGRRYHRIHVDVDGYKERRREALGRFARQLAEDVVDSGDQKALEPMNAADRKVVHDALSDFEGVSTLSEGDDPRRYVVIAPE